MQCENKYCVEEREQKKPDYSQKEKVNSIKKLFK